MRRRLRRKKGCESVVRPARWSLMLGRDPQLVGVAIGVTILAILFWVITVRPERVLQHGQTYATRLFETLDWAPTTPTPPPS